MYQAGQGRALPARSEVYLIQMVGQPHAFIYRFSPPDEELRDRPWSCTVHGEHVGVCDHVIEFTAHLLHNRRLVEESDALRQKELVSKAVRLRDGTIIRQRDDIS